MYCGMDLDSCHVWMDDGVIQEVAARRSFVFGGVVGVRELRGLNVKIGLMEGM